MYTDNQLLRTGNLPENYGMAWSAQLLDKDGGAVGVPIETGYVELGLGDYGWTYEEFPDGFIGFVQHVSSGGHIISVPQTPPATGGSSSTDVSVEEKTVLVSP
jgi:hypothetical protein